MITTKDIKEYQFKTIYDYYNYIVESKINGQHIQVMNLVKKLSEIQRIELYKYLNNHLSLMGKKTLDYILNNLTSEMIK